MEEIKTIETGGLVSLLKVQMTKTRLIIHESTTFEEWQEIGEQIKIIEGAIQWYVGDWINFGERKWGDKYLAAIQATRYSINTLRQQAWVASRFNYVNVNTISNSKGINPIGTRHEKLNWSHHLMVAALDPTEANRLLDESETEKWTVADLRNEVQKWHKAHDAKKPPEHKEYAFSWFHEVDIEAMLDAMKMIKTGINKLINDKRDLEVRIYLLQQELELMGNISKKIIEYLEAKNVEPKYRLIKR